VPLTSDRPPTGRVDGGKHDGRSLHNEGKSHGFRIRDIDGQRFTLDAPDADLAAAFTDAEMPGYAAVPRPQKSFVRLPVRLSLDRLW